MKKNKFAVLTLLAFLFSGGNIFPFPSEENKVEFTEEIPHFLEGIWQGKDRLLFFCQDAPVSVILRVFYSWYNDRAAEPSSYAQISSRDRNNTTALHAEDIVLRYAVLNENENGGICVLRIFYTGAREAVYIPVAVIDGKLFLEFYVRENLAEENGGGFMLYEFGTADGIKISFPIAKKELLSYLVTEEKVFPVRYWLTDSSVMETSPLNASFTDGEKNHTVEKFINSGGNTYTCATGRSSLIRNIYASENPGEIFNEKDFLTDSSKTVYAKGTPYLVLVPEIKTAESLLENVNENNSRKAPPPPPLFPPSEIDFHWKEITELEKYNPYTWNRRNIDIHN